MDSEELEKLSPEEIRHKIEALLNARLLAAGEANKDIFDEYRTFCDKYEFPIDRAFYHGKAEKFRTWFNYRLEQAPLGRGNFGEVFGAHSPTGQLVAVKIMNRNIFGNNDMLAGFRRGVRSMEIVTEHNVEGMVPIIESFELPPTIIMPYVGGLSLEDAIRHGVNTPWLTKLDIAICVARIVNRGHALPQTVLHRDLKPSNIMISNMQYDGSFDPEVVVLDFDMSWHKGSKEKDVVFESRDDFGYLAPEQTDKNNNFSARSTRVDSYGFGMTLFYMFGREAPRPNEALSHQWIDRATKAVAYGYEYSWKSAPARLGRLISRATAIEQSLRVDFATIMHELDYIKKAINSPEALDNAEFWAEEIFCQLLDTTRYVWDDSLGRGLIEKVGGVVLEVATNFRNDSVVIEARSSDQGVVDRNKVHKYLVSGLDAASRALKEVGWRTEGDVGKGTSSIKGEISAETLRANHQKIIAGAVQAVRILDASVA